MKTVYVLSVFVALAYGDVFYEPAYIPVATKIVDSSIVRIAGGQRAVRNQFPYQVSLQRRIRRNVFSHLCGGSIISPNWILSAAHCTNSVPCARLRVVAGILLLSDTNILGQQVRNIQKLINHPLFPRGNTVAPNDISLIYLASPLQYRVNVQPIALPHQGDISRGQGTVSGWGILKANGSTANHLQFAILPVIPEEECLDVINNLLRGRRNPFSVLLNLCSGTVRGNESVCQGDSGGPYVQDGKVVGVVSWGFVPCGETGGPSVYTKISSYTNWITIKTNGEVRPQN